MYGNESDAVLDPTENEASNEKLKRSLKTRHMNMIAIGGALGTGLFLASAWGNPGGGFGGALGGGKSAFRDVAKALTSAT